jgi:acyl carrier protein
MDDTTTGQISAFIRARFPDAEFDDTVDIFSLGFINSLFALELVMFVEKTYALTVPDEDLVLANFRTVAAIGALVQRRRASVPIG